jgi:hypothetical protein
MLDDDADLFCETHKNYSFIMNWYFKCGKSEHEGGFVKWDTTDMISALCGALNTARENKPLYAKIFNIIKDQMKI